MDFSVKFYLEKRVKKITEGEKIYIENNVPILLSFTFEGKRLLFYTGHRVDFSQWDAKKQRVKPNIFNKNGTSSHTINTKLDALRTAANKIYDTAKVLGLDLNTQYVRSELKKLFSKTKTPQDTSFWGRYEQYIKDIEVSEGRRKHLTSTMNHFKRFLNGKTVTFDTITQQAIKDFKAYLQKGEFKNDKEKAKGKNTITGILKRLKAFFNYAIKQDPKWTKVNPFDGIEIDQEKYGNPIYLTKAERNQLYDADLNDDPRLERIRDVFVFQCLIGARVDDLMRLTKSNVVNGAIEYVPGKTKDETPKTVRVLLSEKAKSILDKYDLPGPLLPFISKQKYNKGIKDLFKKVKLNRRVVRLNPLTGIEETVKLSDIASSHMARRTFIGVLHRTRKNEVIASMTGHKENSKAFSRYYAIDDETKKEAIQDLD